MYYSYLRYALSRYAPGTCSSAPVTSGLHGRACHPCAVCGELRHTHSISVRLWRAPMLHAFYLLCVFASSRPRPRMREHAYWLWGHCCPVLRHYYAPRIRQAMAPASVQASCPGTAATSGAGRCESCRRRCACTQTCTRPLRPSRRPPSRSSIRPSPSLSHR